MRSMTLRLIQFENESNKMMNEKDQYEMERVSISVLPIG